MELSQLRYFMGILNSGQITRAAEMMHVSQSAVSMSIARLEEELGLELFERDGRSVKATPAGLRFAEMIAPIITKLDFALNEMQSLSEGSYGLISLSIEMPDFATELEMLYLSENPGAQFRQSMDTARTCRDKLLCGAVDFGLCFEPFGEPEVESELLVQDRVFVQLSAKHPLASREGIWLHELSDEDFVSFSGEFSFRRWTDGMCFLAGFRPRVRFEVCDPQSIMNIVYNLNAVAFIARDIWLRNHQSTHHPILSDEAVKSIPLNDSFCVRSAYLSYLKTRAMGAAAKDFLHFARRCAAEAIKTGALPHVGRIRGGA